ncbi:MAG: site-2 protease family protein [Peptococcaceae bacterium]|nr:site-2 protease family protein [Peptococcaceae bacterium]
MMSVFWTVFWFIIVISVLVFVHEFGHFIMAKRSGIKVIEFALGFGPKLIKVQRGETLYSVRALPLGGFCRFLSEHADLVPELEEGKITQEDYDRLLPRAFERKSYTRRMGVLLGGSVFNLLFGAVLFILLYAVWGVEVPSNMLAEVTPNSPASHQGLLPGDRIVSINGLSTPDWEAITSAIQAVSQSDPQTEPQPGLQTLTLTVQSSEGDLRDVSVTPEYNADMKRAIIGINASDDYTYRKVSPIEALKRGTTITGTVTKNIVSSLFGLFTKGQGADQMVGVVGIAQIVGQGAAKGLYTLGLLTAILSINFCIVNLLPLPALDGGQVATLTYEKIRGKELKPETKGFIQLVGFALLMTLMVVLIFKDVLFPVVPVP